MNHFDYTAPGGMFNNHSTGFSDSWPNSPDIGGPTNNFLFVLLLLFSLRNRSAFILRNGRITKFKNIWAKTLALLLKIIDSSVHNKRRHWWVTIPSNTIYRIARRSSISLWHINVLILWNGSILRKFAFPRSVFLKISTDVLFPSYRIRRVELLRERGQEGLSVRCAPNRSARKEKCTISRVQVPQIGRGQIVVWRFGFGNVI